MVMKKLLPLLLFTFFVATSYDVIAKQVQVTDPTEFVSSNTQKFVSDVQKELGMDSYSITVKGLAQENAMVSAFPFQKSYTVLINEKWFNTFSYEAKRFLIGHELMHIKHKHVNTQALLSLAWPTIGGIFTPKLTKKLWYDAATKKLFLLWYSRCCEKDADISCAKKLKCAQGGIELFESLEKAQGKYFKLTDITSTHPSHKDRIKYLKALAQSAEYKALCAAA